MIDVDIHFNHYAKTSPVLFYSSNHYVIYNHCGIYNIYTKVFNSYNQTLVDPRQ